MVDGDEVPGGDLAGGVTRRALFAVDPEHLAALLTHVDAVVLTFDADGCRHVRQQLGARAVGLRAVAS